MLFRRIMPFLGFGYRNIFAPFCVYTLVSLLYFMIFSLGAHHKLWWLVIADSTTGLQLVGAEKLVLLTHISPVFSQTIMFNETASTGIPPRRYIIVTLPLRLRCQTTFEKTSRFYPFLTL